MRHEWIFDVLTDLKAYGMAHGMVALARKAEEALDAARAEVGLALDEQASAEQSSSGRTSH